MRTKRLIGIVLYIWLIAGMLFAQPKYVQVETVFDNDVSMTGTGSFTFAASGETCYSSNTASGASIVYTSPTVSLDADTITFILEISDADSMYATNGIAAAFDITLLPTSPMGYYISDTTTHASGISIFSSATYKGALTKNVKVFYSSNIKPTQPAYLYGKLSIWIGNTYQTTNSFHLTIYEVRKWRNTY